MDQATELRQLVRRKRELEEKKINYVTVISGKGGVGKTTLVKDMYGDMNDAFIVDADINSPSFWLHSKDYRCVDGFEVFNGKKMLKSSFESKCSLSEYVLVDAGTGLNDINNYYINKSKTVVFVTSMEEISILNTMSIMKKVSCTKIMYIPTAKDDDILDMQSRINRYSKNFLDNSHILVCSKVEDIIAVLRRNRV